MKIGISAPVECSTFEEYLYDEDRVKSKGLGLGGSQVNQIIVELLKRDCKLSIFTLDKSIKVGGELVLKGKNITVYIGPFRRNKMCAFDFQRVERKYLEKVIKEDKPDIVHAHWTYEFALGAINSKIPHLISVRDWAPAILKLIPKPYRVMRLLLNYYVFFKGQNFVANSMYIDKKISNLARNKVELVANAISDESFLVKEKIFNKNNQIIISINNGFGKIKNVSILVKAFSIVLEAMPDVRLILIGKDFEKNGLANNWAKENCIEKNIEFIGEVSHKDILKRLEAVDLLVHPALEESFGNTLIEAMSKKVPVIGGNNSGAVPWVLDNGEAGILTDITDEIQIANKILCILESEEKWKRYSKCGYSRASEEFKLSTTVDRYLMIYKQIIKGE